ncbi:MAG: GntR family transcriptional regulator [Lentisphaerae bacterium]|nr:GntR family transcriptional regulator [Lentisphaerota bacterium]
MKSNGKYVEIADQLTGKITGKVYYDRLPTVRELAAEYNVSLRTIQKALELLTQRTLIVADSTRCMRIVHRPQSRVIGVFCNFRKGNSSDVLVQSLRRRIESDDYEAVFIDVPDKVCQDENSALWRYGWADGYISLYGTSDLAIDRCLKNFELPVVTANLGRGRELPCVDFDHALLMRKLTEGLYKRGFRKIALSFTICSERISEAVKHEFREFLKQKQLTVPEQWISGACEADVCIPKEARIAKQFESIFAQNDTPEAVICFHHGMKFAQALLNGMRPELTGRVILAGTGKGELPEPDFLPVEFSYDALAGELWQTLKSQLGGKKQSGLKLLPPPEINWHVISNKDQ